jgi:UDP-2,3-diacylglucosamine hydrolase
MHDECYFVSDAHLGVDSEDRERLKEDTLIEFLSLVHSREGSLFIVGDLFDFWFEYRAVIPRQHYRIVNKLYELRRSDIPITYVVGNHDYWIGNFFQHELGIDVVRNTLTTTIQGQRLFVAHGDGLTSGDFGYRLLKATLRNPVNITLFSLLHPDIGIRIAQVASRLSRSNNVNSYVTTERHLFAYAKSMLEGPLDAVILGHSHRPSLHTQAGKTYVNLGDWMRHFTYARLRDGALTLHSWLDENRGRPVERPRA